MYINYNKLCEYARAGKVDVVDANGKNCIDPNPVKNGRVEMDLSLNNSYIQVIFEQDLTNKKELNPVVVYYAFDEKEGTFVEKNKITFKSTNIDDVLDMLGWFDGKLSTKERTELIKKLKEIAEPETKIVKVGNKNQHHKYLHYTLAKHINKSKKANEGEFLRIGGTSIYGFEKFKTIDDVVAVIETEYNNKLNPPIKP